MNTEPPQTLCFPTHREKIWKHNNSPGQWLEQNIFRVSMPFVILGISLSPPPPSLRPPAEQIQNFLQNHSQSVPILENILGWEKLRPNVTTRTSREADFKGQHSGKLGIMTLKIGTCLTKKEAQAQDTSSQVCEMRNWDWDANPLPEYKLGSVFLLLDCAVGSFSVCRQLLPNNHTETYC